MPNSNYWVDYDGTRYETTWWHGRRLYDLQMRVLAGEAPPTNMRFQLAGDSDAPVLTVHVGPSHTLEIIPVEVFRPDQA